MYYFKGRNFCGKKILGICVEFIESNSLEKSVFTYLAKLNSVAKNLFKHSFYILLILSTFLFVRLNRKAFSEIFVKIELT